MEDVRIRLEKEGWNFSVQRHKGTYGADVGLFEIGIWQTEGHTEIKVMGWQGLKECFEKFKEFCENPEKFYWRAN